MNGNVNWGKNQELRDKLPSHLVREFEHYINGQYIRSQYMPDDLIHLDGFLKSLNMQELEIFLSIRNNTKRFIGKTFTEVMLESLEKTGSMAKLPILYALSYIIKFNENARAIISKYPHPIERIANSNLEYSNIANSILKELEGEFKLPIKSQFVFKKNSQFSFYETLSKILKRAQGKIWFWDNYANDEILQYIHSHGKIDLITELKIIFKENRNNRDLQSLVLAARKFRLQYQNIHLYIRSSRNSHDRFLIFDSEV